MKPQSVNILGHKYKIEYVANPADVDLLKRKSLWGQIDYWTRTIRIYDNNTNIEDVWETLIHEVLHSISSDLNLCLDDEANHDDLDILATALTDTLIRNSWLQLDEEKFE